MFRKQLEQVLQEVTPNSRRKENEPVGPATLIIAPSFLISILGNSKLKSLRAVPKTFSICVPCCSFSLLCFMHQNNPIYVVSLRTVSKSLLFQWYPLLFSPPPLIYSLCMYLYYHITGSLRGRESKRICLVYHIPKLLSEMFGPVHVHINIPLCQEDGSSVQQKLKSDTSILITKCQCCLLKI